MAESAADQTATTNITLDTIHDLVIAAYKGLESKDREQDDNMAAAESHIFLDNLKERLTKNDVTLERLFAGDNVGKTKAKKIMGKMALVITDGLHLEFHSAPDTTFLPMMDQMREAGYWNSDEEGEWPNVVRTPEDPLVTHAREFLTLVKMLEAQQKEALRARKTE